MRNITGTPVSQNQERSGYLYAEPKANVTVIGLSRYEAILNYLICSASV